MSQPEPQSAPDLPPEFRDALEAVTARRARIVIDHILEHGYVTTEQLNQIYGYDHPHRAVRDVREHGIPIETFQVPGRHGRMIGAYRFGSPDQLRSHRRRGRRPFPRDFKQSLIEVYGQRCSICVVEYPPRDLQIAHRVPFEIGGEPREHDPERFMLVCAPCNRAKSWSCEHCLNWTRQRSPETCRACYWASPRDYAHVATRPLRRIDLVWEGTEETSIHDRLASQARRERRELPDFVKSALRRIADENGDA